jgi:hypothetical protein
MDKMGSKDAMDELEVIDADSQKVAAMLSALPRVEAPSNFEFRVKAGIANGSPSRSTFLPFLKTAAPLALILVVVTFGLLYYQRPGATVVGPTTDVTVSGPVVPPTQAEPVQVPSSTVTAPPQETAPVTTERASGERDRTVSERRTARSNSSNRSQGGSVDSPAGSIDRTLHPANVIMPPGLESANPRNRNANTSATSTDLPVQEVLGMFGVEGDFAGGGWKVRSVKEHSQGSRAKILAGDVIESVDGQPVKNETKLKGGVKTFTVRRDGKVITLSSGN